MEGILFYLLLVVILAAVAIVGALFVRGYLTGTSPAAAIFGPRPEKRLDVVDHASIDGRRRLVLIRRDNVEHLILTGGPVDVVIETGIGATSGAAKRSHINGEAAEPAVFSKPARTFGQAPSATPAAAET
jgi:flagellar protein FliO/FliZ